MIQKLVQEISDKISKEQRHLHTAFPATIMKFYQIDGKEGETIDVVDVVPVMAFKKPDGEKVMYPKICGVPLVYPQTHKKDITIAYPVKLGDQVLCVCSEQTLDYWMYEQDTKVDLPHDLTNAVAIPGMFNTSNKVMKEAYDENALIISHKLAKAYFYDDTIYLRRVRKEGNEEKKIVELKLDGDELKATYYNEDENELDIITMNEDEIRLEVKNGEGDDYEPSEEDKAEMEKSWDERDGELTEDEKLPIIRLNKEGIIAKGVMKHYGKMEIHPIDEYVELGDEEEEPTEPSEGDEEDEDAPTNKKALLFVDGDIEAKGGATAQSAGEDAPDNALMTSEDVDSALEELDIPDGNEFVKLSVYEAKIKELEDKIKALEEGGDS